MIDGPFFRAAPELSELGLAVIPVSRTDKKSCIKWPKKKLTMRGEYLPKLLKTHGGHNIGILTKLSNLTIVDIDDPSIIDDMINRFGATSIVAQSPSGGVHLYYKSNGERCRNLRPSEGLAVDVKAGGNSNGGLIVVPPSERLDGNLYKFLEGDWSKLKSLPCIKPNSLADPPTKITNQNLSRTSDRGVLFISEAQEGQRNDTLFRCLLRIVRSCYSLDNLLLRAREINAEYIPPLRDAEVCSIANQVWGYEKHGNNWVGRIHMGISGEEWEILNGEADAICLLMLLRRMHCHSREAFPIAATSMANQNSIRGWTKYRISKARDLLVKLGVIKLIHKGGRFNGDASLYRFA